MGEKNKKIVLMEAERESVGKSVRHCSRATWYEG